MLVETDALKLFLNEKLNKLCEGDSGALTKYIIALLKKKQRGSAAKNELHSFLCEQLDVFLQKKTGQFVDLLLEAISSKSYINANKDASNTETKSHTSKNGVADFKCSLPIAKDEHNNVDQRIDKRDIYIEREREEKESKKNTQMKEKEPLSETCSSNLDKKEIVDSSSKTLFNVPIVDSINADYRPCKSLNSSYLERCSDYDELGYCLKGSNCLYSHGFDAIPLNMEDLSTHELNFNVIPDAPCGVQGGGSLTKNSRSVSPLCGLPPLPSTTPPPLPPPPMFDANALEPYNPEAPGMSTYYSTSRNMGSTTPSGPSNGTNVFARTLSREAFSHFKPQRTRELIGVPVSSELEETESAKREVEKRKSTFDFSRLGPPKKKFAPTDSVLELRKVPVHLNNIAKLNSHFSRFGKILNLEIAYDNDPESALVKFASPVEAFNAYRSSVAIFNNRFIKVFYHSPEKNTSCLNPLTNLSGKVKYADSGSKYAYSGFISRGERTVLEEEKKFPENTIKEEVKVPFANELQLLRKKQAFLTNSIEYQKVILEKLVKSKNKKEAEYLKKTIETLSSQILTLKSEIKKQADEYKKKLSVGVYLYGKKARRTNKSEKEVLDAEMDSYKEKRGEKHTHAERETEQTESLLSEVNELKEKINPDIVDDEEEEEDDDSEGGRSWRRR